MPENDTDKSQAPFNLNELFGLYGEETTFELLQMSVDEATGLLEQIAQGISLHDAKMVMAGAHQLKGLASTMTINSLATICLEMETAAREDQWEKIPPAQVRLKADFETVAAHIASLLTARKA